MLNALGKAAQKYFGRTLDFRVRLFNVLAMAGAAISIAMALLGIATGAGAVNILINLGTAALSFALLVYSQRSGNYQLCYVITITAIFLLLFPLMFFTTGGYHSGMPAFFVFAIAFTIFMLEGKKAVVFSVLEGALYVGICLLAYRYPQLANPLDSEEAVLTDIIVAFLAVSTALGVSLFLHFRIYNQQQRLLAEQNATLDAINRQKTEFFSSLSHELKTPLAVVSSQVYLGLANPQDAPVALKRIGGEVDRMALMVNQYLDASRIDEGRMTVEPTRNSIVEIVQNTLDTYYPVFSKNHNQLRFQRQGDVGPVRCDPMRVSQVLVNLVSNAARHTRGGEITVSVAPQGAFALVTVTDTGEGIAPERIPHLFERYSSHRPPAGKEARPGWDTGTGLGLFICQYIVEAHGGTIGVESTLEQGTRVWFTLPLDS